MKWLCWWVGTATDPKFRLIARDAEARVGDVVASWAIVLERASVSTPRGNIGSLTGEELGVCLDIDGDAAARILKAMACRGLLGSTGVVTKWEKRQHPNDAVRKARVLSKSSVEASEDAEVFRKAPEDSGKFRKTLPTVQDTTKQNITENSSSLRSESAIHDEALRLWNVMARRKNLPIAQRLTEQRRRQLRQRLPDLDGITGWEAMLNKVEESSFLTGQVPGRDGGSPFKADLDFVLKPQSLQRIVEGKYDDHPAAISLRIGKPRYNPADATSPDAVRERRAALAAGMRKAFPGSGREDQP
jgi:hypothetical protein